MINKFLIISINENNIDYTGHYSARDQSGFRPDILKKYKDCRDAWHLLPEKYQVLVEFNQFFCLAIEEYFDLIVFCKDGQIDIHTFYEDENRKNDK